MAQKYKTILTRIGKEKMAGLIAGEKLELTHLAVGDGELEPNEEQTSLQNEKYRGDVQKVEVSSTKGNRVNILGIIPKDVGGFWIREVGVFDSDGDLVAIGNVGETYKSLASDGSDKELGYNVIIEVDNIDNIELILEDSIVYATKKELTKSFNDLGKLYYITYIGNGESKRDIELPDLGHNANLFDVQFGINPNVNSEGKLFYVKHEYGLKDSYNIYDVDTKKFVVTFGWYNGEPDFVIYDKDLVNKEGVKYFITFRNMVSKK